MRACACVCARLNNLILLFSLHTILMLYNCRYGLFPTVAEYGGLMGAILADPHADPAQVVQLFETLILERGTCALRDM